MQNAIENGKSLKRTFKDISPWQNYIIILKGKHGNILHNTHEAGNGIAEFYEDSYENKSHKQDK